MLGGPGVETTRWTGVKTSLQYQFLRSRVFSWELMSRALRGLTLSKKTAINYQNQGWKGENCGWMAAMSAEAEPSTGLKPHTSGEERKRGPATWPNRPNRWKDRGKHNGEEQNLQQAGQIKAGKSRLQQVTATGKTQRVKTRNGGYMMGK